MDYWDEAVRRKFGFGKEHLLVGYTRWAFSLWDETEDPMVQIRDNPQRTIEIMDKLWLEIANNPATTIKPIETPQVLFGDRQITIPNLVPTSGLIEMSKREINTQAGANMTSHCETGIGTNPAQLTDIALQTPISPRKSFLTDGSRAILGTTARLAMPFSRSDYGQDRNVTEGGLFTAASNGWCVGRVVTNPIPVTTGRIIVVNVDKVLANGSAV